MLDSVFLSFFSLLCMLQGVKAQLKPFRYCLFCTAQKMKFFIKYFFGKSD